MSFNVIRLFYFALRFSFTLQSSGTIRCSRVLTVFLCFLRYFSSIVIQTDFACLVSTRLKPLFLQQTTEVLFLSPPLTPPLSIERLQWESTTTLVLPIPPNLPSITTLDRQPPKNVRSLFVCFRFSVVLFRYLFYLRFSSFVSFRFDSLVLLLCRNRCTHDVRSFGGCVTANDGFAAVFAEEKALEMISYRVGDEIRRPKPCACENYYVKQTFSRCTLVPRYSQV